MLRSGQALPASFFRKRGLEIRLKELAQSLDDKRISAKAGALGRAFQLLAQIRAEADTCGGGEHVILCVANLGLSRLGFKDMCSRGEQGRVEGSAEQGGENVLARGGAETRRGLRD